jgi:septum formation protein
METARSCILLASASPRRRRLIGWLGVPVDSVAVDTAEELDTPLAAFPPQLAASIAAEKAIAARDAHGGGALILAFDTIVVHDGAVLGKPADVDDAHRMLRALSGRVHEVVTGVAIIAPRADTPRTFAVTTHVAMHDLSEDEIAVWVEKGELLGCAGAYNIEHHMASVGLHECYHNVAGLPLCHLYAALASGEFGPTPADLIAPLTACDAARGVCCLLGPELCER